MNYNLSENESYSNVTALSDVYCHQQLRFSLYVFAIKLEYGYHFVWHS